MSVKAMTWAFEQPVSGNEKVVLLALADHANDENECWPSIFRIAEKSSISRRTAFRILTKLEELGFIHVVSRNDNSGRSIPNKYILKRIIKDESLPGEGVKVTPGGDTGVMGEGATVVTPITLIENHHSKTRKKENKKKERTISLTDCTPEFLEFFAAYPDRVGSNPKLRALESYLKAIDRGVPAINILNGVKEFAASLSGPPSEFTPHAATWLNRQGWEDRYVAVKVARGRNFV